MIHNHYSATQSQEKAFYTEVSDQRNANCFRINVADQEEFVILKLKLI
jgi:hypothetical protein